MHVNEIMSKRFAVISDQASIREAAEMMHDFDVGVLPITRSGKLVGILTDRDIVVRGVAQAAIRARPGLRNSCHRASSAAMPGTASTMPSTSWPGIACAGWWC